MRKLIFITFLFTSTISHGIEICNNAIDDDNDGLVDLNDTTDCTCMGLFSSSNIPSLIPNPSFEEMNCCPFSFSELSCAKDWIQASGATTDYLNTCGFVHPAAINAGLIPFPDGNGIVGCIIREDVKEYLGTCLSSPLIKDTMYSVQFSIAASRNQGAGGVCPTGGTADFGALDITIFGSTNCNDLPFGSSNTVSCPPQPWIELGHVSYLPQNAWSKIEITFTPNDNINTIILGSPCILPPTGYERNRPCLPYFYFDNLILNKSSLFSTAITQTGNWCDSNLLLIGTSVQNSTYQWYLDGIALVGQTDSTLNIFGSGFGAGKYSLMITDTSGNCSLSSIVVTEMYKPQINAVADHVLVNYNESVQLDVITNDILSYNWIPASSVSNATIKNPVAVMTQTTVFIVNATDLNNCRSTDTVRVEVIDNCKQEDIFIPNAFSPNSDNMNDCFKMRSATQFNDFHLLIYNRYGEKVFESNNQDNCWNGTFKGAAAPADVYAYTISFKCLNGNDFTKKGNITLLR